MKNSTLPSWARMSYVLLVGLLFSFTLFAQPEPVVVGYYTSWRVFTYSPSEIPLDKVTHILHSFAYPDANGNINHPSYFLDPVPELIQTVHAGGRKVFVALGGWNDSGGFSPMAADPGSRANFIANITSFCTTHGYDGVDLDWEYPADATDMANLNLLVSELDAYWASHAAHLELSMAIPATDWSAHWTDVSFLEPYVEWFGIMTYDYYGNWSATSGHNSPLYLDPNDPAQAGSVDFSINDYYIGQRGVSPEKLVAGIPFYGKKFSKASEPYESYKGRVSDLLYNEIDFGAYTLKWDAVSKVSYLSSGNAFITFNNTTSCSLVCEYAKDKGIKGVMVWELSQDEMDDGSQPLIDVIGEAMLGGGSPIPPDAPTNLIATAVAATQINLAWDDNSSNEHGFRIERSLDGVNFAHIAETDEGVTGYPDVGLSPETAYFYRVYAFNGAGNSGYSNVANATTPAGGGGEIVEDVATSDIPVDGTVSGSFVDTQESDNVYEAIEEVEQTVGPPARRFSYLEHKWTIDVTGGVLVVFNVEAYKTANSEGDDFEFAYSTDENNYISMVTVTKTSDDDNVQTYTLPNITSGTIYIRVVDTDHSAKNRSFDTIFVDRIFVESETALGKKIVDTASSLAPAEFTLLQNYPNPFNPATTISYSMPEAGNVSLIIYDVMGRQVITLVDGYQAAGEYQSVWSATDENGAQMASGVYYAQLRFGSNLRVIKMVLMQ
ncbi:T9SS C-terminal target domain-containing protein [candidate division KSB1 bacterium]|nr:fibronectin type III domain-containing protein [candidate division KSB1 bacterium]RQW06142.1 MAG: T9SS C-terminal target domain-containing protein [candidate division KSB1 bacterium]